MNVLKIDIIHLFDCQSSRSIFGEGLAAEFSISKQVSGECFYNLHFCYTFNF